MEYTLWLILLRTVSTCSHHAGFDIAAFQFHMLSWLHRSKRAFKEELQAACNAMPKAHLTYIVTAYGKPRAKYGLGNDFARWATEAGLPARCRMHGLKKGGMRRLAEHGNTTHELMAISGHRTLSEVQRYTDDADRTRLATSGMAKRRDRTENTEVANLDPRSGKPASKSLSENIRRDYKVF